jgi:membrane peptidoglycan carboxypeptidase
MSWLTKHRINLSRICQSLDGSRGEASVTLTPLELMIIILEDKRFFSHPGVDILSVVRELSKAFTFRRFGGASTIEMQFVRTATGYRQHSIRRKLYEALLALTIQSRYGKLAILRSYMACAFFGSGLIGADAAANKVFGKDSSRLVLGEAAIIAAMLARPRPLAGLPSWEARVQRRAMYGLHVYAAIKRPLTLEYDIMLDRRIRFDDVAH